MTRPAALRLYDLAGVDDELRISPFCWRIRMALAHKGLPFDVVPWRMVEKDRIAGSGSATVPVIADGDRRIGDSWTIARYLDDRYPERPLFDSPQARAYGLFIHHWTERTLHPLIVPLILEDVLAVLHPMDSAYFRSSREAAFGKPLEAVLDRSPAAFARLKEAVAPTRRTLRHSAFLGGTAPAYGDYIVFGAFQWARCCSNAPLLAERGDPMLDWFERMLDLHDGLARAAATAVSLRLVPEFSARKPS